MCSVNEPTVLAADLEAVGDWGMGEQGKQFSCYNYSSENS